MGAKLALAVAVVLVSIPSLAQVQPAAGSTKHTLVNWSARRGDGLLVRAIGKRGTSTGGDPPPG